MTPTEELIEIFSEISDKDQMQKLLEEILTEKERKDLALRWQLMKELHSGTTQRKIASDLRISLCKITRGSKILKKSESIVRQLLEERFGKSQMKR